MSNFSERSMTAAQVLQRSLKKNERWTERTKRTFVLEQLYRLARRTKLRWYLRGGRCHRLHNCRAPARSNKPDRVFTGRFTVRPQLLASHARHRAIKETARACRAGRHALGACRADQRPDTGRHCPLGKQHANTCLGRARPPASHRGLARGWPDTATPAMRGQAPTGRPGQTGSGQPGCKLVTKKNLAANLF
jgi:hypothetical protein